MLTRRTVVPVLLSGLLLPSVSLLSEYALAQGLSQKPITIVVPFPAGGPTDAMARVLGEAISEGSGQSVIVDNRSGGGGQIAAAAVIRVPADGRTLFIGDLAVLSSNPHLYKNFSYNPLVDFQPITTVMSMPEVLYVRKEFPANTFKDLVELGRSRSLNYASQGPGTGGHLLGELMRTETGTMLNHIPYRGTAPAMTDLLGGQVDLLFDGLPVGLPHMKSGKLKALATATAHRSDLLPDVPTTAELGFPDINMSVWFGVVTRAGAPAAVVQDMNKRFTQALKSPKIIERFQDQGYELIAMTPQEFGAFMKAESDRWGAVIKSHQIKVE